MYSTFNIAMRNSVQDGRVQLVGLFHHRLVLVALESLALLVQLAPDTAVGDANDEYGHDVLNQH